MIINFGDKETKKIWNGERSNKLPNEIQETSRRKLRMSNSSQDLKDLILPPSNMLEKLKGAKRPFYSIRINNQWRIQFQWNNNNAEQVEIVDYH